MGCVGIDVRPRADVSGREAHMLGTEALPIPFVRQAEPQIGRLHVQKVQIAGRLYTMKFLYCYWQLVAGWRKPGNGLRSPMKG